jgi:hypothetical protein
MEKVIRKKAQRDVNEFANNRTQSRITKFIRSHFKKDFLTDMRSGLNNKGEMIHIVYVNQDNTIYHLQFNALGDLMLVGAEPIQSSTDAVGDRWSA